MHFEADEGEMNYRERRLLAYLRREYTDHVATHVLRPLVRQECPASLRALDWAVVNWSKLHRVVCPSTVPGEMTSIHQSYRASLAFWRRRLFDPFRRRGRIALVVDGERISTTLGQANWALWCYRSGTLSYVVRHVEEIEAHMNETLQIQRRKRRDTTARGVKHVRKELTSGPMTLNVAYCAPSVMEIDA